MSPGPVLCLVRIWSGVIFNMETNCGIHWQSDISMCRMNWSDFYGTRCHPSALVIGGFWKKARFARVQSMKVFPFFKRIYLFSWSKQVFSFCLDDFYKDKNFLDKEFFMREKKTWIEIHTRLILKYLFNRWSLYICVVVLLNLNSYSSNSRVEERDKKVLFIIIWHI